MPFYILRKLRNILLQGCRYALCSMRGCAWSRSARSGSTVALGDLVTKQMRHETPQSDVVVVCLNLRRGVEKRPRQREPRVNVGIA